MANTEAANSRNTSLLTKIFRRASKTDASDNASTMSGQTLVDKPQMKSTSREEHQAVGNLMSNASTMSKEEFKKYLKDYKEGGGGRVSKAGGWDRQWRVVKQRPYHWSESVGCGDVSGCVCANLCRSGRPRIIVPSMGAYCRAVVLEMPVPNRMSLVNAFTFRIHTPVKPSLFLDNETPSLENLPVHLLCSFRLYLVSCFVD
jgi:hypothetical protein